MQRRKLPRPSPVPVLAAASAAALLAAPFWPALFPAVVIAGSVGACALAVLRRPSRRLRLAMVMVAVWLVVGHAGAWLLRGRPVAGLGWVLGVLYVLPLPLVPWLYWMTFDEDPEPSSGYRDTVPDPERRNEFDRPGEHE